MGIWTCSRCGKKWEDDESDCERIDGKPACQDCYYDELGKHVDKHPIGLPKNKKRSKN